MLQIVSSAIFTPLGAKKLNKVDDKEARISLVSLLLGGSHSPPLDFGLATSLIQTL